RSVGRTVIVDQQVDLAPLIRIEQPPHRLGRQRRGVPRHDEDVDERAFAHALDGSVTRGLLARAIAAGVHNTSSTGSSWIPRKSPDNATAMIAAMPPAASATSRRSPARKAARRCRLSAMRGTKRPTR